MTVAQLIEKIKTYDQNQDVDYSIHFMKTGDVISGGFVENYYEKNSNKNTSINGKEFGGFTQIGKFIFSDNRAVSDEEDPGNSQPIKCLCSK